MGIFSGAIIKIQGDFNHIKAIVSGCLPKTFVGTVNRTNTPSWFNVMVAKPDIEIFRGQNLPMMVRHHDVVVPKLIGLESQYR